MSCYIPIGIMIMVYETESLLANTNTVLESVNFSLYYCNMTIKLYQCGHIDEVSMTVCWRYGGGGGWGGGLLKKYQIRNA